jgi:hypothetical protein
VAEGKKTFWKQKPPIDLATPRLRSGLRVLDDRETVAKFILVGSHRSRGPA